MTDFNKIMPDTDDAPAWDAFLMFHRELIDSIPRWRKWGFDQQTQEDMSQNIRVEVVRAAPNFKGNSSVPYFIKRIGVHRCLDEVRRQIRKHWQVTASEVSSHDNEAYDIIASAPDEAQSLYLEMEKSEKAVELHKKISTLDPTCIRAITLYYIEGMQYPDIAREMNISMNTVGSRISKCLKKLGRELKNNRIFRDYFPAT